MKFTIIKKIELNPQLCIDRFLKNSVYSDDEKVNIVTFYTLFQNEKFKEAYLFYLKLKNNRQTNYLCDFISRDYIEISDKIFYNSKFEKAILEKT